MMTSDSRPLLDWSNAPTGACGPALIKAVRDVAATMGTGVRIVEAVRVDAELDQPSRVWEWLASQLGGSFSREASPSGCASEPNQDSAAPIDVLHVRHRDSLATDARIDLCLQSVQSALRRLSHRAVIILDGTRLVGPQVVDSETRRIAGAGAAAAAWLLSEGWEVAWCWDRVMLMRRRRELESQLSDAPVSGSQASSLPRILWSSNAPWMPTGYGVQTRLFVPRLTKRGYEIALHAFSGLGGGPITWDGLQVYPGSEHPFGFDALAAHVAHARADFVILHTDAWVLDHHLVGPGVRIVPWFPVDSDPIPDQVADRVRRSWRGIVFSRFGQRQARSVGLDVDYVPLAVDTSVYRPVDKRASRDKYSMPPDAFVVGMVAMNKEVPSRKAFPQVLQAFAEFHSRHRDAILYLHTQPRGFGGRHGVDLPSLALDLGIEDCIRFAPEYVVAMGVRDTEMAAFYSALDVLVAPSLGEGFGAPIVEAQACGRPVIVGGWTAMPEICFAGVQLSLRDADPYATALRSWQYVPRVGALVDALEHVWRNQGSVGLDEPTARAGAVDYDVEAVLERFWLPTLQNLCRQLAPS